MLLGKHGKISNLKPSKTFSFNNCHFQLSSVQHLCDTKLAPENSKYYKVLNEEKNSESKKFLEAITVLSVLAEAECKMPAFLKIDYKIESRDKYFEDFFLAIEAFAQQYAKNTNGYGIAAVLTNEVQSLKRSRRQAATAEVNTNEFYSK